MGCEAAPNPVTSAVTDVPCASVLLPVPGSSRTSPLLHIPADRGQAKRRPVRTHNALLPGGRGRGLVRDGLRSDPKPGDLGYN
jgi:hypothetical protein